PDVAGLPDDRRDVDDPAGAALEHVLQRRLRHEERAGEVDAEDLVPVLVGHLQNRLVAGDPGVVDEDVQPPVVVDDLLDGPPAVLRGAHVALMDAGADAVLRELVLERLRTLAVAAVAGGDRGPLHREALADRGADATRPAGDHRDAALQLLAARAGEAALCRGWSIGCRAHDDLSFVVYRSDRSASQAARSGQISFRALDPAISPMCPPGRSRWVMSSLPTMSSIGSVPTRGAIWSAPAVTTSRFCS